MSEKGVKHDGDKPRWGLLQWDQLEQVVDILTFGSKKYSDNNWKHVDGARERYFDAMMRHIKDYRIANERDDPTLKLDDESGKNHLAHAICNALFLMWFDDQDEIPDADVELANENTSTTLVFKRHPNSESGFCLKNECDLTTDPKHEVPPERDGLWEGVYEKKRWGK